MKRPLMSVAASCALIAFAGTVSLAAAPAVGTEEFLSLGSKEWAPTVTLKSGIGTAAAMAEAKVTRKEIESWCANWSPGDKDCVARELARPEAKATYRARADCIRGKITAVDDHGYTLAGVWDASDVGAGSTRWRDASGKIVGRDNASGGLAIAQQWEVLCPGVKTVQAGPGVKRPPPPPARPGAAFAVGQSIQAKYGRDWVRGKVVQVREIPGPAGPEFEYDVRLANGKRGVLSASMLRKIGD